MDSKLYIDYDLAVILYTKMGLDKLINFLEEYYVITLDKNCYYFLMTIQQEFNNKQK